MNIIVKGSRDYLLAVKKIFYQKVLPEELEEIQHEIKEKKLKDITTGLASYEANAVITGGVLTIYIRKRDPEATGAFLAERLSKIIGDEVIFEDREGGEKSIMKFNDGEHISTVKIFRDKVFSFDKVEPDENGILKTERKYIA